MLLNCGVREDSNDREDSNNREDSIEQVKVKSGKEIKPVNPKGNQS